MELCFNDYLEAKRSSHSVNYSTDGENSCSKAKYNSGKLLHKLGYLLDSANIKRISTYVSIQ